MRDFGPPIGRDQDNQIREAVTRLFGRLAPYRELHGRDYAMDDEALLVINEGALDFAGGGRYRLAATTPEARPPFEWLYEITADIGESDYIKHYLVRDDDIVLAQRKVLTPIDEVEAKIILADIATAEAELN